MIRVLYVDDDIELLTVCKHFLERSNDLSVDTAISAEDGTEQMVRNQYDAIISDYQMPTINGIEFLKRLRGSGDNIPFILFTGRGREEVVIEALNSGVDFYVQKGTDMTQFADLAHKIRSAVARRRAEAEIKEQRSRLEALIDSSDRAIFSVDSDYRYTTFNSFHQNVMRSLYGSDIELGKSILDYQYVQEDREKVKCNLDRALAGERFSESAYSGDEGLMRVEFEVTHNPIFDVNGKVTGVAVYADQMTERKKADKESRLAEARYRSLFQDHTAPMLLLDPATGNIVDANQAASEYYGYERKDLTAMKISRINTLDLEAAKTEMTKSVRGEKKIFEFRHRLASGEIRDVEVHSSPIELNGSRFLYSIIHDITDRKGMEKAIRENEAKFHEIFDHANDAIFVHLVDDDFVPGKFLDLNEVAIKMLGYSREEILAIGPIELSTEYHNPPMNVVIENLRTKGEARFETEDRHKDGRLIPVDISSHVMLWHGKRAVVSIVRDITERKAAMNALKMANRKLNLLSSITRHDLNNMLVVVDGKLVMMEAERKELAADPNMIKVHAKIELMKEIIQFTKTYENVGTKEPEWQGLKDIVINAAKDISWAEVRRDIDIPEHLEVLADPLIVKVFYNIMENSMRHGGHFSRLYVRTETSDGKLKVICGNDGPAIATDEKEKIFELGYGKNTGLGLFLAREILELTGATIVENGTEGARFELTFPSTYFRG